MSNKPHPITAIVFGLLIVSLLFNYLQSKENMMLRSKIDATGGMPLIIDVPNPYESNIPQEQNDTI